MRSWSWRDDDHRIPMLPGRSEPYDVLKDGSPAGLWGVRLMLVPSVLDSVEDMLWDRRRSQSVDKEEVAERKRKARRSNAQRVKRRLVALEKGPLDRSAPIYRNIEYLAARIGLSEIDRHLLEFGAAMRSFGMLASLFDLATGARRREVHSTLSLALELPEDAVAAALSPRGHLLQAGLIACGTSRDGETLRFGVPDSIFDMLDRQYASAEDLFSNLFHEAKQSSLTLDDFPHAAAAADLARRLLHAAMTKRTSGVNVLIYGVPAAGKTELAKVLAASVGARLFEVSVDDGDGEGMSTSRRFTAYSLSQRVLRGTSDSILLFDEVEGALQQRHGFAALFMSDDAPSASSRDKGWVNRVLEDNPVPAIWIANGVKHVDPAHVRRFSFTIELKTPPPKVRRTMIDRCTQGLELREEWKDSVSHDVRVAPGHIETAAQAARLIETSGAVATEEVLSRVMDASLSAQGLVSRPRVHHADLGTWDSSFVRASCDLDRVAASSAATGRGTILLYGPPGTGKSAYAQHFADCANRELIVRRGSDLLSMWVGGSEKNIAAMFQEAQANQSVVLLDEADSFLQDRGSARHSWEITMVNELLTQMEAFEGLFVCTTNLVDALDPAAFRRFALKVRFDPPRPDQRWNLFCQTLARLDLPPDSTLRVAVDRATELTPGDFVAVLRRTTLAGRPSDAAGLLEALEEERRTKPGCKHAEVGFAVSATRRLRSDPS